MGLLSLFGLQKRSNTIISSASAQDFMAFLNMSGTAPSVNSTTVLGIPAYWSALRIIGETMASLPFETFYNKDGGRYPATTRKEYEILSTEPNSAMSAYSYKEVMARDLENYGNAFSRIVRDQYGSILSLDYVSPSQVDIYYRWTSITTREVRYKIRPAGNVMDNTFSTIELDHDEMIHLCMMSEDGVVGRSAINVCKEALGMMLAAQKYGAEFYANGAMPSGVLTTAQSLNRTQKDEIAKDFKERYSGSKNSGNVVLLSNGAEYKHISSTPADAKWIETMQFTGQQIAQMMRIPQHLMGILERSTNNNIEQQSIDFAVHSVRPRAKLWEAEFDRKLWLTPANRKKYFTKFNLNALLRGDTAARVMLYNSAINGGWLNRDDIRDLEGMNPIPGGLGQEYFAPLNMHPLSEPWPSESPKSTTPTNGK